MGLHMLDNPYILRSHFGQKRLLALVGPIKVKWLQRRFYLLRNMDLQSSSHSMKWEFHTLFSANC